MTTERSTSGRQVLAGYLSAIGAITFSALSASCVQALQGAIPDFQLSAIRSAVQCLIFFIVGLIIATDFKVAREYIPGLIYFGGTFLLYNVGIFGSAAYLPLGEVQGVVTIVSFVFAIAQSKLLFRKDILKSNVIATFVCIIGIVLIAQPAWMFTKMSSPSDFSTSGFENSTIPQIVTLSTYGYRVSDREVMMGYVLSVLGGASLGVSYDISGLILKDVKTLPKAAHTTLLCTIGSIAFMFYYEDPVYVLNTEQLLLTLGHSLFSAATSFQAIYAYSIIPGPSLSIVMSLEVVTMLASQYTIMHSIKPGNYNGIEVFGCIVIVFGACIPGVMDLLAHRAKASELP